MVNARTNVDKLVEELSLRPRNEQKSLLFTVHLDKPLLRVHEEKALKVKRVKTFIRSRLSRGLFVFRLSSAVPSTVCNWYY